MCNPLDPRKLDDICALMGMENPIRASQRERDKFHNISTVSKVEALQLGLAQCTGYALWLYGNAQIKGMSEQQFVSHIGELTELMLGACGIKVTAAVGEYTSAQ